MTGLDVAIRRKNGIKCAKYSIYSKTRITDRGESAYGTILGFCLSFYSFLSYNYDVNLRPSFFIQLLNATILNANQETFSKFLLAKQSPTLLFTQWFVTLILIVLQLCTPRKGLEVRVWTQKQVSTDRNSILFYLRLF